MTEENKPKTKVIQFKPALVVDPREDAKGKVDSALEEPSRVEALKARVLSKYEKLLERTLDWGDNLILLVMEHLFDSEESEELKVEILEAILEQLPKILFPENGFPLSGTAPDLTLDMVIEMKVSDSKLLEKISENTNSTELRILVAEEISDWLSFEINNIFIDQDFHMRPEFLATEVVLVPDLKKGKLLIKYKLVSDIVFPEEESEEE